MVEAVGKFAASVVNLDNPSLIMGADGDFGPDGNEAAYLNWKELLDTHRTKIIQFGRSVCAVVSFSAEVMANGKSAPSGNCSRLGTGFLVGDDLILTNRHVAQELFSLSFGNDRLSGRFGWITFHHSGTTGQAGGDDRPITEAVYIHDGAADIALLRLGTAVASSRSPLQLSVETITGTQNRPSVVIGYPGSTYRDPHSWQEETALRIFGNGLKESVKRVSPGNCQPGKADRKLGRRHDCTTLPGSSGSPVIDLAGGSVIGIHYHGIRDGVQLNWYFAFADVRDVLEAMEEELGASLLTVTTALPEPLAGRPRTARLRSRQDGYPVTPDTSDFRDIPYVPRLVSLPPRFSPPFLLDSDIHDQDQEPSCTAHAVEAAIFVQRLRLLLADADRGAISPEDRKKLRRLSTRMIYEMALIHDEFPGRNTPGSSIRGAIKGVFHNGVAPQERSDWKAQAFDLTFARARKARKISIAAYCRLPPRVQDYQAAIHEAGAVIVSAFVHQGWIEPQKTSGKIKMKPRERYGAHAFVIVGYDADGFLVLNSAGPKWGRYKQDGKELPGVAHWSYRDWAQNVLDGWVISLAPETPESFGLTGRNLPPDVAGTPGDRRALLPRRHELLGHCIRIEEGKLQDFGRYGASLHNLRETAKYLAKGQMKYDHVLFIAPAETVDEAEALRLIGATRTIFKRNRIYPVYLLAETDFAPVFADFSASVVAKAGAVVPPSASHFEEQVYQVSRRFGQRLWQSYQSAVAAASKEGGALDQALGAMLEEFKLCHWEDGRKGLQFHFLGHSAGGRVVAAALACWRRHASGLNVESVNLFAPLITREEHNQHFISRLGSARGKTKFIRRLNETVPTEMPGLTRGSGETRRMDWTGLASRLMCPHGFVMNNFSVSMLQNRPPERFVEPCMEPVANLFPNAPFLNRVITAVSGEKSPSYPFESQDFVGLHSTAQSGQ